MKTPVAALTVRPATADDVDAIFTLVERGFQQDMLPDEREAERRTHEAERSLVCVDGERLIANVSAFTRDLSIPGGAVPAAHVSNVAVHPMYRRRGLLTRLIRRQLREIRDARREPIAVLWASEGKIYQRFGYGAAAERAAFDTDRRNVRLLDRLPADDGHLREADPTEARKDLVEVYERVRRTRPGWSSRDERWWDKILSDPKDRRHDFTARRAALSEGPDGVDGYALWSGRLEWGIESPCGAVQITEVVAASPQAYVRLWRFLLSVDLTRTVRFANGATDEPLFSMVDEPRGLGARIADSLWVRVVDVPAALTARRYQAPVDVVFDVSDTLLPDNAGRWRLRADGAAVTCEPADGPPDLWLDIADLGAVYLGGSSIIALANCGRVRELRAGGLAAASLAFGWSRRPSAIEVF